MEKHKLILQRQQLWLSLIHPEFAPEDYDYIDVDHYVCNKLFQSGKPAAWNDTEHVDWVPYQNMGYHDFENKVL
jgi:hypothetical protein